MKLTRRRLRAIQDMHKNVDGLESMKIVAARQGTPRGEPQDCDGSDVVNVEWVDQTMTGEDSCYGTITWVVEHAWLIGTYSL